MAGPLICADNFFNPTIYPNHIVSALTQVVDPYGANDHQAFHVGIGRRSQFNYWMSGNTATADYLQVQCDRVRSANFIALDRGHNLAGTPFNLEVSNDGSSWQTVLGVVGQGIVIGSGSGPNSITDTSYGVVTLEGAWACYFPTQTGLYWRLYMTAITGGSQAVVGLTVGYAYAPFYQGFEMPWGEDQDHFVAQETVSPYGWHGRPQKNQVKQGKFALRMYTEDEYDLARYHIQDLFGAGHPTWLCYDMAQADRMIMVARPGGGALGAVYNNRYPREYNPVDYMEWEPQFA